MVMVMVLVVLLTMVVTATAVSLLQVAVFALSARTRRLSSSSEKNTIEIRTSIFPAAITKITQVRTHRRLVSIPEAQHVNSNFGILSPSKNASPKSAKQTSTCTIVPISEASKGGMKVGRIKDLLYKDSYLGIFHLPSSHLLRPPTILIAKTTAFTWGKEPWQRS